MRKLNTKDIFSFCRVLKQLGLKDDIRATAEKANTGEDAFSKGFDLIWKVFDAATESAGENILYDFLAGPFEMSPAEVENLPVEELFDKIRQLADENNLKNFFGSVRTLMK